MTDKWINYAVVGGYDKRDGLDEDRGRWMFDDEKRIQVWVETGEAA